MSIFKSLKKLISGQSGEAPNASTSTVPSLDVRPDTLPADVMFLLWFKDGMLQNYRNAPQQQQSFGVGGIQIEITVSGASEPSAISVSDLIRQPAHIQKVDELPYYPTYESMTPEQRWVYLNWLRDVDQEIDIGYVFIFYYGLERHLFFGAYEAAFRMILRLRRRHRHPSFLGYSAAAITAACIIHKRGDLFTELLKDQDGIEEAKIPELFLLAKWSVNLGLTARELMKLASTVGFSNRRYIKDEETLFESELTRLLAAKYGSGTLPLHGYSLELAPLGQQTLAANYSFTSSQRLVQIPCITKHPGFTSDVNVLLREAHDHVKEHLKSARKSGTSLSVPKERPKTSGHRPSAVFDQSPIFEAIDVHQFDQNAQCYIQGLCPRCRKALTKRPVQKGTCPQCNTLLLVKNSEFAGEKLLLTEQENEVMSAIRAERVRRNWIKQFMSTHGLREEAVADAVQVEKKTIELLLLDHVNRQGEGYRRQGLFGLYRNCLLDAGKVYARIDNLRDALRLYLAVCWYDLCGATNSASGEARFDRQTAFLAPGVLDWVEQAADELGLSREELHRLFLECAAQHEHAGMPLRPEKAWAELAKALPQPGRSQA